MFFQPRGTLVRSSAGDTPQRDLFCHERRKWIVGVPDGIRTRVTAVKGRCPRPLDDGDATIQFYAINRARASKCLGITPHERPLAPSAHIFAPLHIAEE